MRHDEPKFKTQSFRYYVHDPEDLKILKKYRKINFEIHMYTLFCIYFPIDIQILGNLNILVYLGITDWTDLSWSKV